MPTSARVGECGDVQEQYRYGFPARLTGCSRRGWMWPCRSIKARPPQLPRTCCSRPAQQTAVNKADQDLSGRSCDCSAPGSLMGAGGAVPGVRRCTGLLRRSAARGTDRSERQLEAVRAGARDGADSGRPVIGIGRASWAPCRTSRRTVIWHCSAVRVREVPAAAPCHSRCLPPSPPVGEPSARTHPATGPTAAGRRTATPCRGLCAELLAHVPAAQPDTGCPGSRVVRSDVAVGCLPVRDGSQRNRWCCR